ncbi:polyglutamylase complex subunit TTLL1-like isoform X2 [Daktulosphaira vitifoliae]|uniref:polyglutamylase complex subunit TTLL1-like isoform X2 n=1 Tax=Daktulosphaira vitifoliae TaxID=58002 RepID=UPI0021A9FF4E|nr:polyglutamylase complex subunit TTLL1-like isoform X2 [Daktulosphaira vitifoliae]
MKVSYCMDRNVDADYKVLNINFKKLKWIQVSVEKKWNLYWASSQSVRTLFRRNSHVRLNENQIVNHFPNHYELSRKDLLVRNIKRYRRILQRSGNPIAAINPNTKRYMYLDFIPATFVLPEEYNIFKQEFLGTGPSMWIVKPVGRSRGVGIFLINKLTKLKKWAQESKEPYNPNTPREHYVISRYIERPLLIGGRKCDLRMYVLVTSFKPLKAYMYKSGFCRFCTVQYKTNLDDIDNVFVHLTNVSVQKNGREYNSLTGSKMTIHNFRLLLEGTKGD